MMAAATADSGLVHITALYNIKKEPGQEPRPANSRDEQHGAAAMDSDQAVADLAALAAPVRPIAAAAAAQQRASAVPKYVRPVPGTDQAVDDEVESGEEEDCEPVSKRRKTCVTTSAFVGVHWNKAHRKLNGALISDTTGSSNTWASSTTREMRREPSTRRRGDCEATMRTADE